MVAGAIIAGVVATLGIGIAGYFAFVALTSGPAFVGEGSIFNGVLLMLAAPIAVLGLAAAVAASFCFRTIARSGR